MSKPMAAATAAVHADDGVNVLTDVRDLQFIRPSLY